MNVLVLRHRNISAVAHKSEDVFHGQSLQNLRSAAYLP